MNNPYKAKLALLAASFVTAGSLAACNSNTAREPELPTVSVNPAPPPPPPEEVSVNPAPPTPPPLPPGAEISVNPAPPSEPTM